MGMYNAVISGSFAVQYFDRQTWKESDLDIFIAKGQSAWDLERYLCEVENYEFVWEGQTEEYTDTDRIERVSEDPGFFEVIAHQR